MRRLWGVLGAAVVLSTMLVSAASAAGPPEASVTITDYSTAMSGNIGESVAGVTVKLNLERIDPEGRRSVATAIATTNGTGKWSATLTPGNGFGAPDDTLTTDYAPPTGSSAMVPASFSYTLGTNVTFQGDSSVIRRLFGRQRAAD